MNADLSLVEQSDSSACPARSLQNLPVWPPITQSAPSFFCTFLRISQKISISQRLRAGCSLDTEGIERKSQEKEGSRFCTEVTVGEPIGRLRFVLSSCLRLRSTNRWPVPQEPYRQEPFLVYEDRIGGSAIHVPMQQGNQHQLLFFSALLERRQQKISRSRVGSLLRAKKSGSSGNKK